ncbi:hypothetical protein CPB86DRAFT_777882 [Serendipita vermifera]|nr:hypothetical protein CPB86DRAFT_777882 [Serendipita vermifera]
MNTLPQPNGKEKARLCRLASKTRSTRTRSSLASTHNRVLFSTILALAMAHSSVAQAVQVARREHDAWDSALKRAVSASTTASLALKTNNQANGGGGGVNVTRIVVIAIAVTVLVVAVLGLLVILFLCQKKMRRTKKDQAAIAAITDPNIRRFSSRPLSSSQRGEGDWWQPAPDVDPDSEFNPRNSKFGRHSYHSSNRMSHMSQSHSSRHSGVYTPPGTAAQRPYSQGGQGYTYGQTLDNPSSALAPHAGVPGTPGSKLNGNMSRPPSFHSSVDGRSGTISGSSAGGSSIRQSQHETPTTTTTTLPINNQKEKPFQIPDVGGSSIGHGSVETTHAIGYRFGAAMGTIPEDQGSNSLNHGFTSTAIPNPNQAPPSSYHAMQHPPATLQYLQPQMTGASVYSTADPYEMSAMTKSTSGHPGT